MLSEDGIKIWWISTYRLRHAIMKIIGGRYLVVSERLLEPSCKCHSSLEPLHASVQSAIMCDSCCLGTPRRNCAGSRGDVEEGDVRVSRTIVVVDGVEEDCAESVLRIEIVSVI